MVGIAFVLRLGLSGLLGARLSYITFYPATMLAATLCGLGPGLVATAISALLAWVWILPPTGHFFPLGSSAAVSVAVFSAMGVFMTLVITVYQEARQRRAAEALRESEHKLRLAQDAAGIGSWDWSLVSGEMVWSDRCKALFGFAPDTVITCDAFLGAIHPEDRDRIAHAIEHSLASRTDYDVEMRVPLPDGTVRWITSRGRGFSDASGRVVRMAGMALDITAAKLTERTLQEQVALKDQFAKVAASVPGLVCSYRLRPDGTVSLPFTAPAVDDVLGFSQEALARDAAPYMARLHPDDVQRVVEAVKESARTKSPFHDAFQYLHPAKGLRWIEVWSVPKEEPDGSVLWHGFTMDVTDRKKAERALRASEERFRSLLGALPVAVYACDRDGRITFCNEQAVALWGRRPEIGRDRWCGSWRSNELDGAPVRLDECLMVRTLKGEPVQGHEFVIERPDGSRSNVMPHPEPLRDASGAIVGAVNVLVDVTTIREAERTLREVDRRRSEFLAMLSHELRNPLAPIRNSLYLLERAQPGTPQAVRAREVIQRQTQHLTRLVDDLLDATRISRGKIELQRARVDVREVVRRTCDDHRSMFEENEVELSLLLPAGPVWVDVDATRISQVLGNLLQNAAKFTPARGSAVVAVEVDEARAVVRVRDTGVGMEPSLIERLFEPFVQSERGLARTHGGLGLGLALVKGLVELHGGSVSVSSKGPGHGSEFVVGLPLAPTPEEVESPRARGKEVTAGRLVLVIEDNLDAGQTLVAVLETEGHRLHLATDGTTGIRLARELKPDVVLCDIGLPDVSGYDVARTLRADDSLRATRLIAVTGYAQPEDRQRATEAGFDAQLGKPASPEELTALISMGR